MKTVFSAIISLIIVSNSHSQEPQIEWIKSFEINNSNEDEIVYTRTNDGGFLCATDDLSSWYMWLLKINGDYEIDWKVKINVKEINMSSYFIKDIVGTIDNHFYVAIDLTRDSSGVIKFDSDGNVMNSVILGQNHILRIIQLQNNEFLTCGSTWINEKSYGWVSKMNHDLSPVWTKYYGDENFNLIQDIMSNGNSLYIAGESGENPWTRDGWLLNLDLEGNINWEKQFGGYGDDGFSSMMLDHQGNLAISGYNSSDDFDWSYNFWFLKTNESGDELVNKVYIIDGYAVANHVTNSAQGYLITGTHMIKIAEYDYDVNVINVHIDQNGEEIWRKNYGSDQNDNGYEGIELEDNNYLICGVINNDPALIKLNSTILDTDMKRDTPSSLLLLQNYPNPFNPSTKIEYTIPRDIRSQRSEVRLIVYDIVGREVTTLVNQRQRPGNYEVVFNTSSLGKKITSGIYFYKLIIGNFTDTKKMMLIQ